MLQQGNRHILVAGDSTAADYDSADYPIMGWAQALRYFTAPDVEVLNFARPGRSSKSFQDEGHWERLLHVLNSDDFVLIQFGHNDQKKGESQYADEKTYKNNLQCFIREVRAQKANPILLSSVSRCLFSMNGELTISLGNYPVYMREVANETETPLIDLYSMTRKIFQELGPERGKKLFAFPSPGRYGFPKGTQDTSHFNQEGAQCIVGMIIAEAHRQKLELSQYLKCETQSA